MINKDIEVLVQNTMAFESLIEKNEFIQTSESEWIGFIDGDVTGEEDVRQILEENPFLMEYDTVLFGSDVPEGECGYIELLECPQCVIYAFFFRKRLLEYAGSYNRLLTGNNNYEFLIRLAEKGSVYSIPSSADKCAEFSPMTMAYILRRYMDVLKRQGILDATFLQVVGLAEQVAKTVEFNEAMNSFLADAEKYETIAMDTAPCLIMVSSDAEWYGVVEGFADSLARELVMLGQRVITTNGKFGDYNNIPKEVLLNQIYKAIIGFQSPALQSETFQKMKGLRFQFWLDNPIFSIDFLRKTPKQTYFLCQDADYATFVKERFNIQNAIQFPPAGVSAKESLQEKIYDLVFIGSYIYPMQVKGDNVFTQEFVQYMQEHVEETVEQGILAMWHRYEIQYDDEMLLSTIEDLGDVCHNLLHSYRHGIIETILEAGIPVHVFGESWKAYQGKGRENLIIHPKVMTEESMQIWSKAKIGLNIMNGHKAGMTERVANIMLSGACCLSDETSYLREHFSDGEEIVLFRADKTVELFEKILYLLKNDEVRERIALAGQKKALQEHTWRKRAEELLEIVDRANGGTEDNDTI